ncbi:MAG: hypothetical protein RLZZ450_4424 [Pseudomonadota bacterium]
MTVVQHARSFERTWDHPEGAANAVLGGYRVLTELAVGELCSISLARSLQGSHDARVVAVKRLRTPHQNSAGRSRLLREARVLLSLRAPNLVRVLEIHTQPELFVVMEHVPGASLRSLLLRAREVDALRYIVPIFVDALRGLSVLHNWKDEEGAPGFLVHQAPTARHMLVGMDGVTRLIDLSHVHGRQLGTGERAFRGERDRAAPEQLGARAALDPRCDIFIVGTALLEAIACARDARAAMLGESHVRARLGSLQAIGQRARSSARSDRFWSADEMAYALQKAADEADLYADRAAVGSYVRRVLALPAPTSAPSRSSSTSSSRYSSPFSSSSSSPYAEPDPEPEPEPEPEPVRRVSRQPSAPPPLPSFIAAPEPRSCVPPPAPGTRTTSASAHAAPPSVQSVAAAPLYGHVEPLYGHVPARQPHDAQRERSPSAHVAEGAPRRFTPAVEGAPRPSAHAPEGALRPSAHVPEGALRPSHPTPTGLRGSDLNVTNPGLPTTTRTNVGVVLASGAVIFVLLIAALRAPQAAPAPAVSSAPPAAAPAAPAAPLPPPEPPLNPVVTSIVAVPSALPPRSALARVVISVPAQPRLAKPPVRVEAPVSPRPRLPASDDVARELPVLDLYEDGLRSLSPRLPSNPYE